MMGENLACPVQSINVKFCVLKRLVQILETLIKFPI
jgi:hypothetical protein